ncbi:clathrin associated protein complex large subunit [Sporothrix eucalyptigena]
MASLKQFIRNVRAAKTIADERAVIQKESAAIRASFREESHDHTVRRNNVAKLLYLFTLGERTHFGQIECLKLLASPRFADKRLGHLATSLLLDENQEVLTLVTNSLKNDLSHSNQYVVGLALCTLGNIASVEMSRDLFAEIENLISTSNPYIRRKAALCAMRICRKVPDLQEHFIEKATHLLSDRNHGVLLCGLTLVTSLCEADEEDEDADGGDEGIIEKFRQFVPALVRTLKGLASSGYAPEHDVTGITDPFLQVKLLHLLRVLARGDAQTTEQINDILAQVATNTDSSKNVGNSILYEAVRTILDIEADSGLRVLGVNILGKFLANRDNNIRYVALNTLIKVVAIEPNAVQRHRNTILDCLRDPDISIRRRALDLSFTLINESNVRVLIRELLAFLEVADNEFKPTMTSQIGIAADKFAPNKRWHVDTMLRVLSLAGNYVKEPIMSSFIRLVATTPELQTYAVQKLYANLKKDITQESLTQAAAWSIGEYGDALLRGGQYEEEELVQVVKEEDIVDLFASIFNSSYATQVTTEYLLTALMKLTTRLSDATQIERVRRMLLANQTNLDVEVQQRAVEYGNLFSYDEIRRGVLEKMPPPQIKESSRVLGEAAVTKKSNKAANRKSKIVKPTESDLLLDLMGDSAPAVASPTNGAQHNNADLLADILSGGSGLTSGSPAPSTSSPAPASNVSAIMDLFGSSAPAAATPPPAAAAAAAPGGLPADIFSSSTSPPAQQQQAPPPSTTAAAPAGHPVYNGNGLDVTMATQRNAEGAVQAMARFRNVGGAPISAVGLQAAVPKSQKLQLLAISSADLAPGQEATQLMRVVGVKGPLRLRLRIGFTHPSSGQVVEQVNWTEPS